MENPLTGGFVAVKTQQRWLRPLWMTWT